jgi:hypothetical protein
MMRPIWQKDFLLVDFKKGRIEYTPYIFKIRFVWKTEDVPLIASKIFVTHSTAEKLDHFCQFLLQTDQRARLTIIFHTKKRIKVLLTIDIADFPVTDFARTLKIERILQKKVPAMNVSVNTMAAMEIIDKSFYDWLNMNEPKSQISISSFDPFNMQTLMEDLVTVPAGIVKVGSIM